MVQRRPIPELGEIGLGEEWRAFGVPYIPEEFRQKLDRLGKEFQEFKAVVDERDRLKDRFNKERLAYWSIMVALVVALIMTAIL